MVSSAQVLDRVQGLTYRRLDYWCRAGLFGAAGRLGSGSRRSFGELDVEVARALYRVASASAGGGRTAVLVEVAAQVRAGRDPVMVRLAAGVGLVVEIECPLLFAA